MYIELLTRITTQPLPDNDGDEKSALSSVHSLFATTLQGTNGDSSIDKLAQFTKAVQLISANYPKPEDDRLKKELTLAAISQIDVDGTHERLQQF